MKRLVIFALLLMVSLAVTTPVIAQRMTPQENARRSNKAAKKQGKMLKKANKKQQKASKKYAKQQRKETAKANRNLQHRKKSVL